MRKNKKKHESKKNLKKERKKNCILKKNKKTHTHTHTQNTSKTYSGLQFIHQHIELLAKLGSDRDEVKFAGLGGGYVVSTKQALQQGVLGVCDQELKGSMKCIIVLLKELVL